MRYTNLFCVNCFTELIRPQLTCGKSSCMTAWKNMTDDQKDRARALSAMPRSERALAAIEETAIRAEERQQRIDFGRTQLDNDVEEYQHQQQKKQDSGFMPKSLRDMLIANAPIKPEETDNASNINSVLDNETDK